MQWIVDVRNRRQNLAVLTRDADDNSRSWLRMRKNKNSAFSLDAISLLSCHNHHDATWKSALPTHIIVVSGNKYRAGQRGTKKPSTPENNLCGPSSSWRRCSLERRAKLLNLNIYNLQINHLNRIHPFEGTLLSGTGNFPAATLVSSCKYGSCKRAVLYG
jgi:hypothetical protein